MLSLSTKLRAPSISLVVITNHDQEPRLTNMNYQISFASLLKPGDNDNATKAITIGRSTSQCDMSIKYRTVSSCHAKMEYVDGEFLLSDLKSSNGTLVFVRQPVELAYGQLTHIKLGRTILTMQAKHSWTASTCIPHCLAACTAVSQVQPEDDLPSGTEGLNGTWQIRDTQPEHQNLVRNHDGNRELRENTGTQHQIAEDAEVPELTNLAVAGEGETVSPEDTFVQSSEQPRMIVPNPTSEPDSATQVQEGFGRSSTLSTFLVQVQEQSRTPE